MSKYIVLEVTAIPDILNSGIQVSDHNKLIDLCETQYIPIFKYSDSAHTVWFTKYKNFWLWAYTQ